MKNRRESNPKQIVYLWGAGATQGEISYLGAAPVNLGMQDSDHLGVGVATRVVQKLEPKWRDAFASDKGIDIEKLISLLAASGVQRHERMAVNLRQRYFEDICGRLAEAKILSRPTLAMALLELHSIEEFQRQERLTGIITTNHDGLLQLAAQQVYGHVNIGIPFLSKHLTANDNGAPPILQLHGSFTWKFGLPIEIKLLDEKASYSREAVWIPPTILKESKSYPFNKLAGLAYEILSKRCDVLRVVGCSLTQNDWNVLSMLFNAQRHREVTRGLPFRIELIMPQTAGDDISRNCSYLQHLFPIGQLSDGDFEGYRDSLTMTADMKNPVFYWLKEKIVFHHRRGDFGTSFVGAAAIEVSGGAL